MLPFALLCVSWFHLGIGIDAQTTAVVRRVSSVHLPNQRVSLPSIRDRVLPPYPSDSTGVRGFIEMEIVIDRNGEGVQVRVVRPLRPDLDQAALEAASKCRFRPATDPRGNALAMLMILRIEFDPPSRAGTAGSVSASLLPPPPFVQPSADLFASAIEPGPKTPGSQVPKVLRDIIPSYTPEAMRAKVQGTVELQLVVLADGSVGAIRIVKSLDDQYGLDRQAIEAAARWLFEPATINGTVVAAKATLVLEFRLR
jgi:TonB family protein